MKYKNICAAFAAMLSLATLTSCDEERDFVIIEGNLPIKTSTLYMVGDATPNGWNIDAPTPLAADEEDPLVFTWEGKLNAGEMKLCLTPGSWDAPFIRPMENGTEISKTAIDNVVFDMHAGDPDNKWRVAVAGIYNLKFDLRNWTMSTVFVREPDAPAIVPIEAEAVYMVGDAAPNSWNIDAPTQLEKKSDYEFVFEGVLNAGEMKCCTSTGSWDVDFIRPAANGCKIDRNGVESPDFVYTKAPDDKWSVAEKGIYRITLNLRDYKIAAEYLGEAPEKQPIETELLFMIGDATPGGWSLDDAAVLTVDPDDKYVFTWEGDLVAGEMKAGIERDFGAPFIHPESADCEISHNGVAAPGIVYATDPDDKWKVTEAGRYKITFNLREYTINVEYTGAIVTESLFLIGSATPGGWSLDDVTELTVDPNDKFVFTWEGDLVAGEMKAGIERDFGAKFIRPESADCEISHNGVAAPGIVYTQDPDDKWKVTEGGRYRITFNLKAMTIAVQYINE